MGKLKKQMQEQQKQQMEQQQGPLWEP